MKKTILALTTAIALTGCIEFEYQGGSTDCDSLAVYMSCYADLITTNDPAEMYDSDGNLWTIEQAARYCSDLSGYPVNLHEMRLSLACGDQLEQTGEQQIQSGYQLYQE